MFNVVRILMPESKVIKTHPPLLDKFDAVLASHRDLRRVAASLWRKWGHLPDYDWPMVRKALGEVVQWHEWWLKHEAFRMDMKYEEMVSDPKAMIAKIAASLGREADPSLVLAEMKKIKLPEKGHDPQTLLHWNHITSNDPMCLNPLTEKEAEQIQERFRDWQRRHGYG